MEIDCSEKFDGNEKNVAKELDIVDKNIEKCEIGDKEQKDMVANTQDGAETKTVELTAAADGIDAEPIKDGGSGTEFIKNVTDSQDCDNSNNVKSEETKSQIDLSGSTENDGKEDTDLLVPMAEFVEEEDEEMVEEECEKSSPIKGGDAELISDTDDYNDEDDIEDDEEDDDNDTSSLQSEEPERNVNPSKGVSDVDDDESEVDEYNTEDDEDDVELVPDSSDEDDIHDSQDASSQNHNIPISDDEDDDDDDYDDDDLMDSVILSTRKKEELKESSKEKGNKKFEIPRKKAPEIFKKKLRLDHRIHLKKRSVRW